MIQDTGSRAMQTRDFSLAGWAAAVGALFFVAEIVTSFMAQMPQYSDLLPRFSWPVLLALHILPASYATWLLRAYLGDNYDFHKLDRVIPAMVVAGLLSGVVSIASQYAGVENNLGLGALRFALGLVVGGLSVGFGYILLSVPGSMNGLKKPLAIMHLAAPPCFLVIVLAPVGLLLLLASEILLALVFFAGEEAQPEFV